MRGKWVKGFVTATVLLVASTTPAYAAWTPATTTLATSSAYPGVQVEVVPVTGYTGGNPSGAWVEIDSFLQGAVAIGADVPENSVSWILQGISEPQSGATVYYQVVAVQLNGITYGTTSSTGTWVTMYPSGNWQPPKHEALPTPTASAISPSPPAPAPVITAHGDGGYTVNGTTSSANIGGNTVNFGTSDGGVPVNIAGKITGYIPSGDCTSPDVVVYKRVLGGAESECVVPSGTSQTVTQAVKQASLSPVPYVGTEGEAGPGLPGWCIGGARNGQLIPSSIPWNSQKVQAWCNG